MMFDTDIFIWIQPEHPKAAALMQKANERYTAAIRRLRFALAVVFLLRAQPWEKPRHHQRRRNRIVYVRSAFCSRCCSPSLGRRLDCR